MHNESFGVEFCEANSKLYRPYQKRQKQKIKRYTLYDIIEI